MSIVGIHQSQLTWPPRPPPDSTLWTRRESDSSSCSMFEMPAWERSTVTPLSARAEEPREPCVTTLPPSSPSSSVSVITPTSDVVVVLSQDTSFTVS